MGGGCCIGNCCIGNFNCCVLKMPCFSDSCCVGNAPGPSESDIHAKAVADELAAMKTKTDEESQKIESSLMEYIGRSFNTFLREIRDLNQNDYGGKKLNINIDLITKKNDELKNQVVGFLGNVLNERLVLTDKELSIILEERDEKKRKKNFQAFTDRIQTEGKKGLSKKIEITVNQQSELVKKEINARLKEVNKSMTESVNAYTAILESKKKDGQELERMQVEYMYQSSLCDLLLNEAEN